MNQSVSNSSNQIPLDSLTGSLFGFSLGVEILMLVKFLLMIGLVLYLAFAVIVVRQVNLMTKTLKGNFDVSLKLASWLHLIVSMAIFVFALTIL